MSRDEAREQVSERLITQLQRARRLHAGREAEPERLRQWRQLAAWQSARLQNTYPDLLAHPRYRLAVAFFLEELYGPKDFSGRDADIQRAAPLIVRMLPAEVVDTVADAMELNALSHELDERLLHELRKCAEPRELDAQIYAEAYRSCDNEPDRRRQIELLAGVGRDLDRIVGKRLVQVALKMMRTPARLAGFAELQQFLEQGLKAFSTMRGADHFLATVVRRETALMQRLFAGELPDPSALDGPVQSPGWA